MVRPSPELTEAAAPFICVRVTNMLGIDLSTYTFDYDLTFCSLLMNADGTIYHVYGGRDHRDPDSQLSMPSLIEALNKTVIEHKAYRPKGGKRPKARFVDDLPPLQRRIKNKQFKTGDCVHCHSVHDFQREHLREQKRFKRNDVIWIYPDPIQLGITLKRGSQRFIDSIAKDSPADKAGLAPGDEIQQVGDRRVLTYGDLSAALHAASPKRHTLEMTVLRDGTSKAVRLKLPARWKEADPQVFAWRPSQWPLSPKPGFGGPMLTPQQLKSAGLPEDAWAFRVRYIVTWGSSAHTGRNALQAGIRKGDIVVAVDGKRDFDDGRHFHAWVRLTKKAGDVLKIDLLRKGKALKIDLPLVK